MIFMGLDVGSSGCKCVAFSEDGVQLSDCYKEYRTAAGQADMDADEMFASVCGVISGAAAKVKSEEISAIAVTSFGESFVPVDRNGEALSRIIMYTDKRGMLETDALVEKIGSEKIMHITCDKPDAMYSLPKIMWSMNNVKGLSDRIYKFLLIADYICYKLCGEAKINYSLACRALAFDVEKRSWSSEMLSAAGIDSSLMSETVPCGSIVGTVHKKLAEKLGIPYSTQIVISAHDQISSAIGAGVFKDGQAIDGTGSVECITPVFKNIIRNCEFTKRNFVCLPHADTGLYATYAFNFSGGVLLKWFRDCFCGSMKAEADQRGVSVYRMLDETCPELPTDILVVPHFMGAGGTPDMVVNAKGTITGLTMKSSLPDIYRAVMEGLTYEIAYNIEMLGNYGIDIDSLRATGGGAKSPFWLQLKADITGKAITPIKASEAGAAGCAMLAAIAMGRFSSLDEAAEKFVSVGEPFVPSDRFKDIYAEKYDRYKTVRNSLLNIF